MLMNHDLDDDIIISYLSDGAATLDRGTKDNLFADSQHWRSRQSDASTMGPSGLLDVPPSEPSSRYSPGPGYGLHAHTAGAAVPSTRGEAHSHSSRSGAEHPSWSASSAAVEPPSSSVAPSSTLDPSSGLTSNGSHGSHAAASLQSASAARLHVRPRAPTGADDREINAVLCDAISAAQARCLLSLEQQHCLSSHEEPV